MALEREIAGIREPIGDQSEKHGFQADGREARVDVRGQEPALDRVADGLLGAVHAPFLDAADAPHHPLHLVHQRPAAIIGKVRRGYEDRLARLFRRTVRLHQ